MPYVISSPTACDRFPPTCPYCGLRPADAVVQLPYSKMEAGGVLGGVTSQTWTTQLPGCGPCARWFRLTRPILFLLGFSTLLVPFLLLFASEAVVWAWYAAFAGWLALLVWRRHRAGAFRIRYMGPDEIVYTARSRDYAQAFAFQNGLSFEHRAFVVRAA